MDSRNRVKTKIRRLVFRNHLIAWEAWLREVKLAVWDALLWAPWICDSMNNQMNCPER